MFKKTLTLGSKKSVKPEPPSSKPDRPKLVNPKKPKRGITDAEVDLAVPDYDVIRGDPAHRKVKQKTAASEQVESTRPKGKEDLPKKPAVKKKPAVEEVVEVEESKATEDDELDFDLLPNPHKKKSRTLIREEFVDLPDPEEDQIAVQRRERLLEEQRANESRALEVKKAPTPSRRQNAVGVASFEAHPEDDEPEQDYAEEDFATDEELEAIESINSPPKRNDIARNAARRSNDRQIVQPSKLKGDVNPKKVRAIVTLFGQRADTILRLLDDDAYTDGAITLMQRSLLQTLVDVLPVVERQVRRSKGQRGVMPLNQVISQMRELATDIQALRDKGQLGAQVVERILRPSYLDLGVQIVIAFTEVEQLIKTRVSEEDFHAIQSLMSEPKRNLASFIQDQYTDIRDSVINQLS